MLYLLSGTGREKVHAKCIYFHLANLAVSMKLKNHE